MLIAKFLFVAAASATACSERDGSPALRPSGPLRVVVTLPPLEGLVRPLLPENATIRVLIPPGRSEHGFEPTVEDALALEQADVVVLVGMGLESSVDQSLRKRSRPYRHEARLGTILGLEDDHVSHGEHDHAHSHETHGHDGHEHAVDPHVWLDPVLVKQALPEIARLVKASISEGAIADPAAVDAALSLLTARVDEVDAAYKRELAPLAGSAIVTHHAAFGRLASRYQLRVVEVMRPIEGAEPTPANVARVADAVERERVRAIFVEPQFDKRGAELIAERAGVRLGTLDPLGTGDWFGMMESNLRELVEKLGP